MRRAILGIVVALALAGNVRAQEKKYTFVQPSPVAGLREVGDAQWKNKTVVFPINVWGGWAPIIAANGGFKPNPESLFAKEFGFQVDLRVIDNPADAMTVYASGEAQILWGTVDMLALYAPILSRDPRTAPQIYQQIDFSNGGDGIVVRPGIKSAADLKGKEIVLTQNSPSHFYLLTVLKDAGLKPEDVKLTFTSDAFGAADAFVAENRFAACVSWSPRIYEIVDPKQGGKPDGVPGARLLTTTRDASNLIADVWAVRADFAKAHPDVVRGLVIGIFKGMDLVKKDPTQVAKIMAEGFGIPAEDCRNMMLDAHLTNFAENRRFFLDTSNPANFDRLWRSASEKYMNVKLVATPVVPDRVRVWDVLNDAELAKAFAHHRDDYAPKFGDPGKGGILAEREPIVIKKIIIQFPSGSNVLDATYDQSIPAALEEIGEMAARFGAARILIEGNADGSMKAQFKDDPQILEQIGIGVKQLSEQRADAVKASLIEKFKFDPNKFITRGNGWNNPVIKDARSEEDHAKNRRVEIKVLPLEGG